jgi:3-dehydroquinate synthetase
VPPVFPLESYIDAMMHDKKVKDGTLQMILNRGIGQAEIVDIDDPIALLEPVFSTLKRG